MKRIILFGMPGAGKGTQALKIRDQFGYLHISTGDMIRKVVAEQTESGNKLAKIINEGKFIPDEVIFQMVEDKLKKNPDVEGYLMDGFPRNIKQAKALSQIPVDQEIVFYLEVKDEAVVGRILGRLHCTGCGAIYHTKTKPPKISNICDDCGSVLKCREDDQRHTISKRLSIYRSETTPVLDYYKENSNFSVIDAAFDEEQIFSQILKKL
jgi:adenylate kinase